MIITRKFDSNGFFDNSMSLYRKRHSCSERVEENLYSRNNNIRHSRNEVLLEGREKEELQIEGEKVRERD